MPRKDFVWYLVVLVASPVLATICPTNLNPDGCQSCNKNKRCEKGQECCPLASQPYWVTSGCCYPFIPDPPKGNGKRKCPKHLTIPTGVPFYPCSDTMRCASGLECCPLADQNRNMCYDAAAYGTGGKCPKRITIPKGVPFYPCSDSIPCGSGFECCPSVEYNRNICYNAIVHG